MQTNMKGDALRELLEEYINLLDGTFTEQTYQDFLEKNTRFIPREFIQNHGLHFDLVLRKLSLSQDFTTDFFYPAKSSADWHCVFIEIEKPQSKYFKTKSNDFHPDFVKALEQINRWRAWLSIDANRNGFTNGTLGEIRGTMGQNPCFMKYVLVHGRREEYEKNDFRRSLIRAQERDDFRIVSFDSLADPSYLRVSEALKDDIAANRDMWRYIDIKGIKNHAKRMDAILPKLILK